jgi:hypothetical protein
MNAIPSFFEIKSNESMKRVADDSDSLILSMTRFDPSKCLAWKNNQKKIIAVKGFSDDKNHMAL